MYCFGVDIGGTTVKMGFFDEEGNLLDKWEIVTRRENGGCNILPDVAKAIEEKLAERSVKKEDVIGIGVGVPAPVTKDGLVKQTANLNWEQKNVKTELEDLTGIMTRVENDANVAALGEMWKGGGAGNENMVMITLGTGVGGGIIYNGHILSGTNGAGGEIGHLVANPSEKKKCGCGKTGCLEQYASATGIVRLAKKALLDFDGETVLDMQTVTAKDVFDAVKAGDQAAIEIATEFGEYLGHALATVSALVDPAIYVIGGGVSKAGEILFDFIKGPYMDKVFFANEEVKFALAKLGNDAGIYGGAKLVLSE